MTEETQAIDDEDENADGCGLDFNEDEVSSDEELPAATGGVSFDTDEEYGCGCDLVFEEDDLTPDEELPATEGGVAWHDIFTHLVAGSTERRGAQGCRGARLAGPRTRRYAKRAGRDVSPHCNRESHGQRSHLAAYP